MSDRLARLAGDLEGYLRQKIPFYFAVGWMREEGRGDSLIVYFDERERIPSGVVPNTWRSVEVRTQGILPPGTKPAQTDYGYAWMVM